MIPAVITVPVLHRVAPAAARELLLTGEVFGAERALQIGLVNAVDDDVDAAVARFVRALQSGGPTRTGRDEGAAGTWRGRLGQTGTRSCCRSPPPSSPPMRPKKAPASFAEKRPAEWVSLSG